MSLRPDSRIHEQAPLKRLTLVFDTEVSGEPVPVNPRFGFKRPARRPAAIATG